MDDLLDAKMFSEIQETVTLRLTQADGEYAHITLRADALPALYNALGAFIQGYRIVRAEEPGSMSTEVRRVREPFVPLG